MQKIIRSPKDFGQLIRHVRKQAGMTQSQLAVRSGVWQETISRLSGRELIIPKTEELVAYGAAAQAAGILSNEPAVEVSARWDAAEGQRIASQAVDSEAIERNSRIREVSHELNKSGLFVT